MSTANTIDPQQAIQQAIKKVTALATLPEVTTRIIQTVEDPNSTANQLHKIISHDPALVTRILNVVNSAIYGLPGQIGSIERAIVRLGLNAVKNIAVAASLGQLSLALRGSGAVELQPVRTLRGGEVAPGGARAASRPAGRATPRAAAPTLIKIVEGDGDTPSGG